MLNDKWIDRTMRLIGGKRKQKRIADIPLYRRYIVRKKQA